jgi:hypothetical protein
MMIIRYMRLMIALPNHPIRREARDRLFEARLTLRLDGDDEDNFKLLVEGRDKFCEPHRGWQSSRTAWASTRTDLRIRRDNQPIRTRNRRYDALGYTPLIPITGGTFQGPNMKGGILPGGWDWQLKVAGGCHLIDASYMIQTDDDVIIHAVNRGFYCSEQTDAMKPKYTTPSFEAPRANMNGLMVDRSLGTLEGTVVDGRPFANVRIYQAVPPLYQAVPPR